jgi:hypothetical protein
VPMIDIYAVAGTFDDPHALAQSLAAALMAVEQVPDIPMFRKNTAAFVHEMPSGSLSNVDGDTTYVRVQVLTNAGGSTVTSSWQLSPGSRRSWRTRRAILRSPTARGCCSLKHLTVDGVSPGTPTPMGSSSRPPALSWRRCQPRGRASDIC